MRYNLEIHARPSQPYADLPYYNQQLTDHRPNRVPGFETAVIRHHIVPFSRIRDFWNTLVERNGLVHFRRFLLALSQTLDTFNIEIGCGDRETVTQLLHEMAQGSVEDGGTGRPPGWDDFVAILAWLPGNLFIGPENRSDDPGEGFEQHAAPIVGDRLQTLQRAYNAMGRYIDNHNAGDITLAANAMFSMIQNKNPYLLKGSQWIFSGGRYRIRN